MKSFKKIGLKLTACLGLFVFFIIMGFQNPNPVYSQTDLEPNNDYSTASDLVLNGRNTGNISSTTDEMDYWKFTMDEDGEFKIAAIFDDSLNIDIHIYDDDGATELIYTRATSSPHVFGPYGLQAGTYYLKVKTRYGGDGGTYTFDTTYTPQPLGNDKEPNENSLQADDNYTNFNVKLNVQGITEGHVGYIGGGTSTTDTQDWWRVELDTFCDFQITAIFDDSLNIDIRIYDDDGATELIYTFATSSPHVFGPYNLQAGTYYLNVKARYGGDYGGYHFEINCPGCGDGILESGEQCDDGNNVDGDCCDAKCQFEVAESPCEDGLFCTADDTCNSTGTCQPGTPVDCADDGIYCNGMESCNEATDSCVSSGDPCPATLTCNETSDSCDCDIDADCNNGSYCDGVETCDTGTGICQDGTPNCPDDGLFCNGTESCNEATDSCVSSGDPCPSGKQCVEANDCCGIVDCLCPLESLLIDEPETLSLLRQYRDNVLSKTPEGREIIKLYYQWSPFIVKAMEQDEEFEQELKRLLDSVLPMIEREVE